MTNFVLERSLLWCSWTFLQWVKHRSVADANPLLPFLHNWNVINKQLRVRLGHDWGS